VAGFASPASSGQPARRARTPRPHAATFPPPVSRDQGCQSRLPVDTDQRVPGLADAGLDLVDRDDLGHRVPGEHIDRATFAEDRKRDLDSDLPPSRTVQGDQLVDDARVPLID
jgi:hypothetical protein